MSIQAVAAVLEADVGEVAAKMLLVCIANAHNTGTGVCCPSIDRLAKESGMSRSSVKRWLRWLSDEGFVEVVESRDDNGRQRPNSYKIHPSGRGFKLAPLPQVEPGEGSTVEPLGGSTCEPALKEPEYNRKIEREGASARTALFEEFEQSVWSQFPQNPSSNKARAFDLFVNLPPTDRVACIRGVARLSIRFDETPSDEPIDRRLQYHPHLATWIKARGWEQELAAA